MKIMTKNTIKVLLVVLSSNVSMAHAWLVKRVSGNIYQASNQQILKDLSVNLESQGAIPEVLEFKQASSLAPSHIMLLRYNSGMTGTSRMVNIVRGSVIDKKNNKVLLDAPIAYNPSSGNNSFLQPKWSWSKDGVRVVDQEFGETFSAKFN